MRPSNRRNVLNGLAALAAVIGVPVIALSIPVSGLTIVKAFTEFVGLRTAISERVPQGKGTVVPRGDSASPDGWAIMLDFITWGEMPSITAKKKAEVLNALCEALAPALNGTCFEKGVWLHFQSKTDCEAAVRYLKSRNAEAFAGPCIEWTKPRSGSMPSNTTRDSRGV